MICNQQVNFSVCKNFTINSGYEYARTHRMREHRCQENRNIKISNVSQWNGLPDTENFSEFILCMRTSSFPLIYNHIFSITFKCGDCAGHLIFIDVCLPHTPWSNELYVRARCHRGISSHFLESV